MSSPPRTWPTATPAPPAAPASAWPPPAPARPTSSPASPRPMLDSIPMVCITGQVSSKVLGSDAFQEIDITGITLPHHQAQLTSSRAPKTSPPPSARLSRWPAPAVRALSLSTSPRTPSRPPRPSPLRPPRPRPPRPHPMLRATSGSIDDAIALICAAKKPPHPRRPRYRRVRRAHPGPRLRRTARHPRRQHPARPRRVSDVPRAFARA